MLMESRREIYELMAVGQMSCDFLLWPLSVAVSLPAL